MCSIHRMDKAYSTLFIFVVIFSLFVIHIKIVIPLCVVCYSRVCFSLFFLLNFLERNSAKQIENWIKYTQRKLLNNILHLNRYHNAFSIKNTRKFSCFLWNPSGNQIFFYLFLEGINSDGRELFIYSFSGIH